MIIGIGIDLAPIARIEAMLLRFGARAEHRLFTDAERAFCRSRGRPAEHFAARFAAKEAAIKALAAPPGLRWQDLEVVSLPGGAPSLALAGKAREQAERLGVSRSHLSLTHAGGMAAAVVILEA